MKWTVVLLTLLCLCQGRKEPPKPSRGNGCLPGWSLRNERCFYISASSSTYENAMKFCASQKSELVPPLTCDTQNVLNTILVAERLKCKNRRQRNCEEFWIGIDKLSGGTWSTSRGFNIPTSNQCRPWAKYYPKDDGRCVLMSYQEHREKGTWKNANCAKGLRYVCMSCPDDFYYMPEINQCLHMYTTWNRWDDARTNCGKLHAGAELVTIKNHKEQEAVARFLQSTNRTRCRSYKWTFQEELFWTGGQTKHRTDCKTPYVWKPVRAAEENFTYSHWYPGMPNCGFETENCVAISSAKRLDYRWEDIMCATLWCSICEF